MMCAFHIGAYSPHVFPVLFKDRSCSFLPANFNRPRSEWIKLRLLLCSLRSLPDPLGVDGAPYDKNDKNDKTDLWLPRSSLSYP